MRATAWLSQRKVYAVAGVLFAPVKYLIDRSFEAQHGVHWLPWHYWVLGVYGLRQYGWGLFVGAPFAVDLLASVITGAHVLHTRSESLAVAGMALLIWGQRWCYWEWRV